MRILVFGYGQVAQSFQETYPKETVVSRADVANASQIADEFKKYEPDAVLNAAGKTKVDWCQQHPKESIVVNTLGAYNIYQACKKRETFFCHLSTGCIYQSTRPDQIYYEEDSPQTQGFYSLSKVWAEELLNDKPNVLILRPRLFLSAKVHPRNLLCRWLTFSHFITDFHSRTILDDAIPVIYELIRRRICGKYHLVNEGLMSDYEAALILKETINPQMTVQPTTLKEVNRNLLAPRVSAVLSTAKLKTLGYQLPAIKESFPKLLSRFQVNLKKSGGLERALESIRQETQGKYRLITGNPSTFDPPGSF